MDKDKKIFLGILLLLLLFMVFVGILIFKDKKEGNAPLNAEAILFKNEYEALNNIVNEQSGKVFKELTISPDNPVDILSEEEAVTLLENETGILFMGFPECPWCRNLIPILLQTLENMGIDRLYYLNIKEIRDTLTLDDKNKVEVVEEGTPSYYKMLDILQEHLNPYYLVNSKGAKVDTKEKRIYAPTVVFVKNGVIADLYTGIEDGQTEPFNDLTEEQEEDIINQFVEFINKVYDVNCDEAC